MTGRRLILKSGDKNGTIRIFGTMDCPMKVTSKLLKPAVMEGFNGYELLFTGEFFHPAAFYWIPTAPFLMMKTRIDLLFFLVLYLPPIPL